MSSSNILSLKHIDTISTRVNGFGAYVICTSVSKHFSVKNYNITKCLLPRLNEESYQRQHYRHQYERMARALASDDILLGAIWSEIHNESIMANTSKESALAFRKYLASNLTIEADITNMMLYAKTKGIKFTSLFADQESLAIRMYLKGYITFGTIISMATITKILDEQKCIDPLLSTTINHLNKVKDLFWVNTDNLKLLLSQCKENV